MTRPSKPPIGEKCDDGKNNGSPGSCTPDCTAFVPLLSCGNGKVDAAEQCDHGANNGKATDSCDSHCRLRCGNGIKDTGEACDDGVNNGSYGTCKPDCTLAPYCGDGVKASNEACDDGAKNVALATAYGKSVCTSVCTKAPVLRGWPRAGGFRRLRRQPQLQRDLHEQRAALNQKRR